MRSDVPAGPAVRVTAGRGSRQAMAPHGVLLRMSMFLPASEMADRPDGTLASQWSGRSDAALFMKALQIGLCGATQICPDF
jgi:hypothetical protein